MESTCILERDELQRLLENTAAPGRQRITSEMPALTLEEMLQPEPGAQPEAAEPDAAEPDLASIEAIADPVAAEIAATNLARIDPTIAIVALSFTVTLLLGLATSLLF